MTIRYISFIAFLLGTALIGCSASSVHKSGGIETALAVNVRTLGAKGDGKADDTPFFLAAIAQAKAGDGVVLVPQGQYKISQTL